MSDDKKCVLCGNINHSKDGFDENLCECDNCGRYGFTPEFDTLRYKSAMLYYLLHKKNKNSKGVMFIEEKDRPKDERTEGYEYVNKEILNSIYPKTFSQKMDMILFNIYAYVKYIGGVITYNFDDESEFALTFVEEEYGDLRNQALGTIKYLIECELLEKNEIRNAAADPVDGYTLTPKGWAKIESLQKNNDEVPQGFIAMWFDEKTEKARRSIKEAIGSEGYIPIIIDDKEHNNQIVPEILYEIEKSKFVVADLTGHRNGVYYEAGYAQALGKEVILTCSESDFGERHFDVHQKNIIRWKDEDELLLKLTKRIEATINFK